MDRKYYFMIAWTISLLPSVFHLLIVFDSYSASNSRLSSMSMGLNAPAHAAHTTYPNDLPKSSAYSSNVATTSNIAHYDPYAPPRRPSGSHAAIPSSGPKTPGFIPSLYVNVCDDWCLHSAIRFKDSPFFTIDQAVSGVVECPGKPYFVGAVREAQRSI